MPYGLWIWKFLTAHSFTIMEYRRVSRCDEHKPFSECTGSWSRPTWQRRSGETRGLFSANSLGVWWKIDLLSWQLAVRFCIAIKSINHWKIQQLGGKTHFDILMEIVVLKEVRQPDLNDFFLANYYLKNQICFRNLKKNIEISFESISQWPIWDKKKTNSHKRA